MKSIITIFLTAFFSILYINTQAQGCVAIRTTGGSLCTMLHPEESTQTDDAWQINIGDRYFKSFRHFIGTEEQKERLKEQTQVINHANTLNISIARNINKRTSISVGFPILANARSQRARFGEKDRFSTHSFGLGDLNITVYRWMFDPTITRKGNIQLGLGLKLATGDYKYQDYFPTSDTSRELRTVDQSIQLGDGGTGITTELNWYYNIKSSVGLYGNLYYLINPREQNGVPTYRSNKNEAIMSVPDQYMARLGVNYGLQGNMKNLSFSLGGRLEGIPVHDLVGGSEGFRRPGYIVSVEPGVNLMVHKSTFFLSAPVALVRCRTQSVPDKMTTAQTGVYTQGDAAFADYLISVGFTTRF